MLMKHEKVCGKPGSVFIDFPAKDKNLSFTRTEYNFKRIYNGYAEFESVLMKTKSRCVVKNVENTMKISNVMVVNIVFL